MAKNNEKKSNIEQSSKQPCVKQAYSYHTFILPFVWKIRGVDENKEYSALKKVFDNNCLWERTDHHEDLKDFVGSDEEYISFYQKYQYFFPFVRRAVYSVDEDICANYLLTGSKGNGKYRITRTIEQKGEKRKITYELDIEVVRVRIVNTGVALFILECVNNGGDANGEVQNSIEAVKNINEYGRRIALPILNKNVLLCADSLEIDIPGLGHFYEDFRNYTERFFSEKERSSFGDVSINHICNTIKDLMSCGSEYEFISHPATKNKEIQVIPLLDDRMYVTYAVSDKSFIDDKIKGSHENSYTFLENDDDSKNLYELSFMDSAGNCTCPDKEMRNKLVREATYCRWLPEGTINCITQMGFGMVSGANSDCYLFENYQSVYREMVYLAMIQRASIVRFNRENAEIAKCFASNSKKLERKHIRKIMNLRERCTAFNSQLFFSEITSEQQGIELYDMLKECFALESEKDKLNNSLTDLYEITDTALSNKVNTGVDVLTWASIILAAGALLYDMLFVSDVVVREEEYAAFPIFIKGVDLSTWGFIGLLVVLLVIARCIINWKNRRK